MRKPGNVGGERPSPSFLTQEQREALDAALSKKRAEQRESQEWNPEAPAWLLLACRSTSEDERDGPVC